MQSTAKEMLMTAGLENKTKVPNTEMKLKTAKTNEDKIECLGKKLIESVQPGVYTKAKYVSSSKMFYLLSNPHGSFWEFVCKLFLWNIQEKPEKGSKKVPAITETVDSKKVTPRVQTYEMEAKSSDVNGTHPSGAVSICNLSGVIKVDLVHNRILSEAAKLVIS